MHYEGKPSAVQLDSPSIERYGVCGFGEQSTLRGAEMVRYGTGHVFGQVVFMGLFGIALENNAELLAALVLGVAAIRAVYLIDDRGGEHAALFVARMCLAALAVLALVSQGHCGGGTAWHWVGCAASFLPLFLPWCIDYFRLRRRVERR